MRKILRELRRSFPGAEIEVTGGTHYRVNLPGGGIVIISSSPSDKNYMRIARADVRRQTKSTATQRGHHE